MRYSKDELKRRRQTVAALLKAVQSGQFVTDKSCEKDKKTR